MGIRRHGRFRRPGILVTMRSGLAVESRQRAVKLKGAIGVILTERTAALEVAPRAPPASDRGGSAPQASVNGPFRTLATAMGGLHDAYKLRGEIVQVVDD